MTDRKPPQSRAELASAESDNAWTKRLIGEDLRAPLSSEETDWLEADLDEV